MGAGLMHGGCCAIRTSALLAHTSSVILSADIMSGFLEGDVAKGYTQGVKLNSLSRAQYIGGNTAMLPALRRVHTHTRMHTLFI